MSRSDASLSRFDEFALPRERRWPHEGRHQESGCATASPVTDGVRLYAHFGSAGTFAYTLDGELVWKIDLGDMTPAR
jgi:hypothetical protein